jgi:hypothetical protein
MGMKEFARGYAMRFILAILLALPGSISLIQAHHSGAAVFDGSKTISLSGTVTSVEWTNPHAHFFVDVKDAAGKVVNWNLELASPNILSRNGWKRDSLKKGDTVTVTGNPARDNSNFAIASTIVFPDGRKLNFMSAYENGK